MCRNGVRWSGLDTSTETASWEGYARSLLPITRSLTQTARSWTTGSFHDIRPAVRRVEAKPAPEVVEAPIHFVAS